MIQNIPPIRVKNMADIADGRLNDHYEDRLRVLGLEKYAMLPLGLTSHCESDHVAKSVLCASKSVKGSPGGGIPMINTSSVDVNLSSPEFKAIA
jgi:hypothetical protein